MGSETKLARVIRERDEALEQQTATSEILASISGSMTDPKPVFDAIVRNLLRLLGTRFASVSLLHDGIIEMPAADGMPEILGHARWQNRGLGSGLQRRARGPAEQHCRPVDSTQLTRSHHLGHDLAVLQTTLRAQAV